MAEKKGSSSYETGDTGGSHGDYMAAHGMGSRMASMHEEALSKASPTRLAKHSQRVEKGRSTQKTTKSPGTPNRARMAATAHAANRGQHIAKSTSGGKSNWAAWNAAHKK